MNAEQIRIKAKLNCISHRAFWWIISDLQDKKGLESDVIGLMKSLEKLYNEKKEEDSSYIQKEFDFE